MRILAVWGGIVGTRRRERSARVHTIMARARRGAGGMQRNGIPLLGACGRSFFGRIRRMEASEIGGTGFRSGNFRRTCGGTPPAEEFHSADSAGRAQPFRIVGSVRSQRTLL